MSSIPTKQIDGDVAVGRNVSAGGNANIQGNVRIGHNLKVEGWLDAPNIKGPNKGVFLNEDQLKEAYPVPRKGWWALVGDILPAPLYIVEDGKWVPTGEKAGNPNIDMEQYREEVIRLGEAVNDVKEGEAENSRNIDQIRQSVNSIGGSLSSLENKVTENEGNLAAEATVRASADNEMMAAIALLRRALDESEDGTFAQGIREDIDTLFGALTMIRDDQQLSQAEIDQIKADIESILSENFSDRIENLREVLDFLDGVKDTDSLFGLLENIRQMIRDDKRDLQSHANNNKVHISVLSLAEEEELDDEEGAYVRPGMYRVQIGAYDLHPDRNGDMLLFNAWGRWDYTISEEDGTWSVPVHRVKINRYGVWSQSGTYNSDNIYSHDDWKPLGVSAEDNKSDTYMDFAPDDSCSDLKAGMYVYAADSLTEERCVMAVSYCDGLRKNIQGGGYTTRWSREYQCLRLSALGLECRTGRAYMGAPSQDPFPITWDEWEPVGSGAAECFTDEEIEAIAMSVGGYILPAEVVEPMTDPEIDDLAVKTGIADNT